MNGTNDETTESDTAATRQDEAGSRLVLNYRNLWHLLIHHSSSIPPRFNSRRQAFMQPNSYIPAELQNMFSMGYFVGQKEYIPTGWHTVDEDKTYPSLSSRNPYLPQGVESSSTSGYEVSVSQAGSDTSEVGFASNTRMNDESSDEDEDIPAIIQPVVSSLISLMSLSPISRSRYLNHIIFISSI